MSENDELKNRIFSAVEHYSNKQLPKRKRKNKKPEKTVQKEVMWWCKSQGFSVCVYEAKAKYNPTAGRYLHTPLPAGHSDIAGVNNVGIGIYIELKAKGQKSTINKQGRYGSCGQREFLIEKILHNAFAVVVDNSKELEEYYKCFKDCKSSEHAKAYLISVLPKRKAQVD